MKDTNSRRVYWTLCLPPRPQNKLSQPVEMTVQVVERYALIPAPDCAVQRSNVPAMTFAAGNLRRYRHLLRRGPIG
eukprot:6188691-Pleurochrysis_carterae.AAC.1